MQPGGGGTLLRTRLLSTGVDQGTLSNAWIRLPLLLPSVYDLIKHQWTGACLNGTLQTNEDQAPLLMLHYPLRP